MDWIASERNIKIRDFSTFSEAVQLVSKYSSDTMKTPPKAHQAFISAMSFLRCNLAENESVI